MTKTADTHEHPFSPACRKCKDEWIEDRIDAYRDDCTPDREAISRAVSDWFDMIGEGDDC